MDIDDLRRRLKGHGFIKLDERHEEGWAGLRDDWEIDLLYRTSAGLRRVTLRQSTRQVGRKYGARLRPSSDVSELEYQRALAQHGPPIDSDEVVRAIEERAELRTSRDRLIPKCPVCRKRMTARVNANGGSEFWGCPSFPKCKGTRPMHPAAREQLHDLGEKLSDLDLQIPGV